MSNDECCPQCTQSIRNTAVSSNFSGPLLSAPANSQVVLFTQDCELRYTWVHNPHLGFTTNDVLGKRDDELLPSDEASILTAIKRGVLESGQPARETVHATHNDVTASYDLFVEPLRDHNGSIVGVHGASTDVTAHRQVADELRFQNTVLQTISDVVIAVDLSGRVLYWNHGAEQVFGYTSEEMLGQPPDRLFSPEDRTRFPQRFAAVMDGQAHSGEFQMLDKRGERRWIEMSARAIRDRDGTITGVVGVGKDVTERKRAEDDQRFHVTLLESIHDSVIVTDLSGLITYWNRGAEDIFGYPAEQVLGQTLSMLYPDGNPELVAADLREIAAGNDYNGEWCAVRDDGDLVWLDIRTTALRDPGGKVIGFVGVGKDITKRKRAEQLKDQLLLRQRHRQRHLRQFLALVAHDLRSPLASISGFAQLLGRRALALESDEYATAVDALTISSEMMMRLISDIGDAAAAGEGQFSVQPAPVEMVALVDEVVATCQSGTDNHHLTLSAPSELHGEWDAQRLRQLFSNLIENAIKYSPAGGQVVITLSEIGNDAVFTVQDFGIGINPDAQAELFELFSRGEETEDIEGFGLGLYICRAIVGAHAGRIEVESVLGQGSRFTVTLPRTRPVSLSEAESNT